MQALYKWRHAHESQVQQGEAGKDAAFRLHDGVRPTVFWSLGRTRPSTPTEDTSAVGQYRTPCTAHHPRLKTEA